MSWTWGTRSTSANTTTNPTQFTWGSSANLPWNYKALNENIPEQTVVTNRIHREYLCFGYARKCYNKSIPTDILKECLNMFGLDGFCAKIDCKHLINCGYYQTKIFQSNQINFQILIKRTKKNNNSFNWGNASNNDNSDIFYIKLIHPPKLINIKTAKIVILCTINCQELNIKSQSIINTSFEILETSSVIMKLETSASFSKDDLVNLESVQFCGNLDLLHIYTVNIADNILNIYHPNIKMNKRIYHKWQLNPSKYPSIKTYISPAFNENKNWNLKFSYNPWGWTSVKLRLQLLSLPPDITSIFIAWRCLVQCNGIAYTNGTMAKLKLDTANCSTCFDWNRTVFNMTETDYDKISSVLFISCIEIIHAEKRDYNSEIVHANKKIDNNNSTSFSWSFNDTSNNWTANTIPNGKTHYYGIFNNGNNNDKIDNLKKLKLHKQIFNVKLFDNDTKITNSQNEKRLLYIDNAQDNSSYITANDTDLNGNEDMKQEEMDTYFTNEFAANSDQYLKDINRVESEKIRMETLSNIEEIISEQKYEISDIENDKMIKNMNVNGYEWISKQLQRITPKHFSNILNKFKEHEVTDKRLIDLDSNDWKEIIHAIGIRNQMKKAFKQKIAEMM